MRMAVFITFLLLAPLAFAHETNETHEEPADIYENVNLTDEPVAKQVFWYSDIFLVIIGSVILVCLLLLRLVKFEPSTKKSSKK